MDELLKHEWILKNVNQDEISDDLVNIKTKDFNAGLEVTYKKEQNLLLLTDSMLRAIVENEKLKRMNEDKLEQATQSLEEENCTVSLEELFLKNLKTNSKPNEMDTFLQKNVLTVKKNQFVFQAGNQVDGMYVIKKGKF